MTNYSDSTLPLPSWWMDKTPEEIGNLLLLNALQVVAMEHGEEHARKWLQDFNELYQSKAVADEAMKRLFK